jgi:5-methylcytosine-specific restriction endonuclease McrA
MNRVSARIVNLPVEISAQLYIGDYFADTLLLSAQEHEALGALLLHVWLKGPVRYQRFASAAHQHRKDWLNNRSAVLPLYEIAVANISRWKKAIRDYDGKRLPPTEWYIVKTIVLARDNNTCAYCGSTRKLHVDHIFPVSRGGSNSFENLTTSCGPCNQSKGPKLLAEWSQTSAPWVNHHGE